MVLYAPYREPFLKMKVVILMMQLVTTNLKTVVLRISYFYGHAYCSEV